MQTVIQADKAPLNSPTDSFAKRISQLFGQSFAMSAHHMIVAQQDVLEEHQCKVTSIHHNNETDEGADFEL